MQWLSSLVNEYDGKPLQKTGMLSKDQLKQFFQRSAEQFNNPEFKHLLHAAFAHKQSTEETVNEMQKQIFQGLGVQGDFGLNCLSRVVQTYNDDAAFMRAFYEHVQREEQALDEAELPDYLFQSKYEQLNKFKSEMEARLDQLQGLTPEEQQRYMAQVVEQMIAKSTEQEEECCSDPKGCSHRRQGHAPADAAILPPVAGGGGSAIANPVAETALSEAEQLAFFQNLSISKPS